MIPELIATQFYRFMSSGRTSPALVGCTEPSGEPAGEFVVKLKGALEQGGAGLLNELIAARLAVHFGIAFPEAAVVAIEEPLARLISKIEPVHSERTLRSIGLNFGTRLLVGANTWPSGKSIPDMMLSACTEVFMFDAMIQNPDRRVENPNLLTRGDSVFIFDHEMAFSFLRILPMFRSVESWKMEGQRPSLERHVFYRALKGKAIDCEGFLERLQRLSDGVIQQAIAEIPQEWKNDDVPRIEQHLCSIRDHAEEFAEEARRFLA